MKKLFLIIGAPGSGKTTDAQMIAQRHENTTHYSTGDMFRDEVASGSDMGKLIDSYVSNGELVPIGIVIETIVGAIKKCPTDVVIIDGYPRSMEQMVELDNYLVEEDINLELINVIEVDVSPETAKERVLGRARGNDDSERVFNNRMKIFLNPLKEIREFYTKKGILHKISGEGTIKEIVDEMDKFIQSRL